jgi:hypothetical protein
MCCNAEGEADLDECADAEREARSHVDASDQSDVRSVQGECPSWKLIVLSRYTYAALWGHWHAKPATAACATLMVPGKVISKCLNPSLMYNILDAAWKDQLVLLALQYSKCFSVLARHTVGHL